jgi:hypothetical protein
MVPSESKYPAEKCKKDSLSFKIHFGTPLGFLAKKLKD